MVNINVIGRLGADAEINGDKGFVNFRMAVDDRVNNERTTTWFRVTLFGERFIKLAEYLTKGKLINVTGTETVGTYVSKQDGSTQVSREIIGSNVEFISVSSGATASDGAKETTSGGSGNTTGTFKPQKPAPAAPTTTGSDAEDDLPF